MLLLSSGFWDLGCGVFGIRGWGSVTGAVGFYVGLSHESESSEGLL